MIFDIAPDSLLCRYREGWTMHCQPASEHLIEGITGIEKFKKDCGLAQIEVEDSSRPGNSSGCSLS